MTPPRANAVLWLFAAITLLLSASAAHAQQAGRARGQASAQARGDKRSKPARKAKRARAARKHAEPTRNAAPEAALPKPEAASPEAPAPAPGPGPGNNDDAKPTREGDKPAAAQAQHAESELDPADVHEEGGTQVKVMEFSGLDIEGQLKTPQMLYFLNRLRAEFGRPRLPHRSFMPELQAGTQDKAMR